MKNEYLCQLISKRINPIKFQIRGLEVYWLIKPTKEELAIVDDVIKNYETLEAEYLSEQRNKKERSDTLSCLLDTDIKSIRAIREVLVGVNPSAISHLREYEAIAKAHRNNLVSIKIDEIK